MSVISCNLTSSNAIDIASPLNTNYYQTSLDSRKILAAALTQVSGSDIASVPQMDLTLLPLL